MLCLKRNFSELIAMQHKLNYTVEGWQQVDNYINFFHSQNQKAKAGSMAFRSRTFDAMYLAAESFVFAWDTAEPHI